MLPPPRHSGGSDPQTRIVDFPGRRAFESDAKCLISWFLPCSNSEYYLTQAFQLGKYSVMNIAQTAGYGMRLDGTRSCLSPSSIVYLSRPEQRETGWGGHCWTSAFCRHLTLCDGGKMHGRLKVLSATLQRVQS